MLHFNLKYYAPIYLITLFGSTLAAQSLQNRYIDIHAHTACFKNAPKDASIAADSEKTPCYVGDILRLGHGLSGIKKPLTQIKYQMYPKLFGLTEGEDYVKVEKDKTFALNLEQINKFRDHIEKEKLVKKPRSDSEKYNSDNIDYFIFEHISTNLDYNKYTKAAVMLAIDQIYDSSGIAHPLDTPFYVSNEFVINGLDFIKTKFKKNNLMFGASVHPYRKDALSKLEYVKKNGAKFVKLIPAFHKFHADDKKLEAYYKKLVKLKLPLMLHIDEEGSFGESHDEYTGAYKLEYPLSLGVTVVVSHMASKGSSIVPNFFIKGKEQITPLMSHYEQLKLLIDRNLSNNGGFQGQLFAEISVLPQAVTGLCSGERKDTLYHVLNRDYERYWKGRLLYGSDYPLNHPYLRPRYCFTHAILQKPSSVKSSEYVRLFEKNGVTAEDTESAYNEGRNWDHDYLMKKAFGVTPEIFEATESFLNQY